MWFWHTSKFVIAKEIHTVLFQLSNCFTCFSLAFLQLTSELISKPDWESRISLTTQTLISSKVIDLCSASALSLAASHFYRKLVIADQYRLTGRLDTSTSVTLVRAADSSHQTESLGEDYGVRDVCGSGVVNVHVSAGGHETFIASDKGAETVSGLISAAFGGSL